MFTSQVFQDILLDLWPHQSLSRSHPGSTLNGSRAAQVQSSQGAHVQASEEQLTLPCPSTPSTLTLFFISGAKGVQLRQRRYS